MAVRKGGLAAPAKQKLRKSHGPKRRMFHKYDSTMRLAFARCGLLSKYCDYESFAQSVNAKGVKKFIPELWIDFQKCTMVENPDHSWTTSPALQKEYFKNILENAQRVEAEFSSGKIKKPLTKTK